MDTKIVKFFFLMRFFGNGDSLIYDGFSKVFGTVGSATNVRTSRLLNQLCNASQGGNSLERDACYGCFFRASTQPSGYPMLLSMATCADNYLNNTDYGHCKNFLRVQLCVGEALEVISNFSVTDVKLAQLFVNTTACILAKTRCAPMNPITGAHQQRTELPNKLGVTSINALFVNSYYDINIIQLPFGNGMIDECAKFRNARQAEWPSARCIVSPGF